MITLILLAVLLLPFVILGGGSALVWKKRRRSILRWTIIAYFILSAATLFGIMPYFSAWSLTHASTRPTDKLIADTPGKYQLQYEDVSFEARDRLRLKGWLIPPTQKNVLLICSHGLFRNRLEMLGRIVPLAKAGYGALLYDSRGHGSSDKGVTSLGYYERNDVLGAIQYVRRRYQDAANPPRIVLMGVSMGAIAIMEGAAETKDYSGIIIDSPYSSLRQAVIDHSWLFLKMPRYLFPPLFFFWFQRLAGFNVDLADAHEALTRIQPVPILIIASEGDKRIGPAVARALYRESQAPIKKLRIFGEDVGHGAAARIHPEAYGALLRDFLESAFGDAAPAIQ